MHRNVEGLNRSARLRSQQAMERALTTLNRLERSEREINFRTVAAEARVSTAWLYSEQELRSRIMRLRRALTGASSPDLAKTYSGDLSKKSIIAALRLRVKKLEEENRELRERLEHAYGVIAEASLRVPGVIPGSP